MSHGETTAKQPKQEGEAVTHIQIQMRFTTTIGQVYSSIGYSMSYSSFLKFIK